MIDAVLETGQEVVRDRRAWNGPENPEALLDNVAVAPTVRATVEVSRRLGQEGRLTRAVEIVGETILEFGAGHMGVVLDAAGECSWPSRAPHGRRGTRRVHA